MAETEKFELEVSMGATVTIFDAGGQPVDWLRPGSAARHTWYGMPTQAEIIARYSDMVAITSATLEDGLVNARARAIQASQGK